MCVYLCAQCQSDEFENEFHTSEHSMRMIEPRASSSSLCVAVVCFSTHRFLVLFAAERVDLGSSLLRLSDVFGAARRSGARSNTDAFRFCCPLCAPAHVPNGDVPGLLDGNFFLTIIYFYFLASFIIFLFSFLCVAAILLMCDVDVVFSPAFYVKP